MRIIKDLNPTRFSLFDAMRAEITDYLQQHFAPGIGLLGNLDRWTQQRIADENLAKLELILESDGPAEACYRDLIREIDAEAESGIYLARADAESAHLRTVVDEPGVSGELYRAMPEVAPVLFADEVAHSAEGLDLVWVTVRACHDRAHVDAGVSGIIMSFLVDDRDSVLDMTHAMRALQYSFHEDVVRRRCHLPVLLGDRENRDLLIMVSELAERAGCYEKRSAEIRKTANTT